MVRCVLSALVALVANLSLEACDCAGATPDELRAASEEAVSPDATLAAAAIVTLRGAGPAGLVALCERHREVIEANAISVAVASPPDLYWERLRTALDAVGAQRDCYTSRLYWHTSLDSAREAAFRESKPILSLRLLGRLTDEFSCANSRFFRTALYANRDVGNYLREHFVLHWQSVRPVPRVTIDFGDGRRLERTLTGNSIHYILDANGRLVDALPGLYGPRAFLRQLRQIEGVAKEASPMTDGDAAAFLMNHHRERLGAIDAAWRRDLAQLNVSLPAQPNGPPGTPPDDRARILAALAAQGMQPEAGPPRQPGRVNAFVAGERAMPKLTVEFRVIRAVALNPADALRQATTPDIWTRLATLHADDAELDMASRTHIRRQNPQLEAGGEDPPGATLEAMIQTFQASMALDTVRNEYDFHRRIHEWLATGPAGDLDVLNDRAYAELFLTPRSDPWLGLDSPEAYTGLENGGLRR